MKWSAILIPVVARVQSALPLVAVAGLAAYTWWLVQSAPGSVDQPGSHAPEGVPDYVLVRASVERFDAAGQTTSVLQGQSISHYLEGDRVVVKGLHLSALDPQGQALVALASEGQYRGSEAVVDLAGQARVTVTPKSSPQSQGPVVFEGNALTVDTQRKLLRSDQPVRLSSAQGVVNGSSLQHDARTGISQLGGRASGRLQGVQGVQGAQP